MFENVNNTYDSKKLYNLADKIILMPDLFGYLLTGKIYAECSMSSKFCKVLGIKAKNVVAVAGHNATSAVVAVTAKTKDFVYISCGTWSLFETELSEPCNQIQIYI